MAVAVKTSGSQTATVGTEHDLATITDAGVYVLVVDVNAMLGGTTPDLLILRAYGKARSSDTERLLKAWSMIGVQSEKLFYSPPIVSPHHLRLTLDQDTGTSRSFPWAVYQV